MHRTPAPIRQRLTDCLRASRAPALHHGGAGGTSDGSDDMTSFMHLFRRAVFGWDSSLRNYELACLNAIRSALTPPAQRVLSAQLEAFDLIQRFSNDRLVTFHDLRNDLRDASYKQWPEGQFFTSRRKEELLVASAWFRFNSKSKVSDIVRVNIVLYGGRLGHMDFDKSPRKASSGEWAARDVEILRVTVWFDPMSELFAPGPLEVGTLRGWIGDLAAAGGVVSARSPLPPERRSIALNQFETEFPSDYLEVITQADGCDLGGCKILGLSELWRIVLLDRTFIVIAEVTGRADIAVSAGARGQIYLLEHEQQDVPRPSGESLQEVLLRECRSSDSTVEP